ncbi:glycosyltransferase family 2 protein, partial [Patescibacteria group bacterium]|nr:glycosyltransferase family 2 protein [Patescibacteria group bacterium]
MDTTLEVEISTLKVSGLIRKHRLWRLLELIPGSIAWIALITPLVLSFFVPQWVATFVIIYTVVWLFRSIKLSINLYRSFKISKQALKTNWNKMISLNDSPEKIAYEMKRINKEASPKKYFELSHLQNRIQSLQKQGDWKKSKDIYHAIVYVTYKESYRLIHESIRSYAQSKFPAKQIIMVLAGEEADKENFIQIANKIAKEFGDQFAHFMITIHPKNVPGEIRGKSANATYAAKQLKKYIDKNEVPYDNVILSNFDADTVVHPQYFSELTYKYLTTERRTEKAYQPTHLFHNNIWDVPVMIRMVAQSCSYWRMAESMEKSKYKSFSSRSLSFQTVLDVNYWDPSVIPEDSRQFWTAFAVYDGRHTLVPIFSPVYMDAVLGETYMKTFRSQYNQLRRWAWGVCDFPFVVLNLWYHPNIKLSQKIYQTYEFLKNSFFWATGPILITFTGFIPGIINPGFRETVLAYNVPRVMSDMLTFASLGIIMCALISIALVPYNPKKGLLGQL